MNREQRKILVSAAVVIVVMLFFPPFKFGSGFTLSGISNGYNFIGLGGAGSYINWALLLVQWAGVLFLSAVIYFTAKDSK